MLSDKPAKFIEDFLNANPQKPLFTEVALSLRDFMKAYCMLKYEGDAPSKDKQHLRTFQGCLFAAFCERTNDSLKWEN